jgi:hypothetical protein
VAMLHLCAKLRRDCAANWASFRGELPVVWRAAYRVDTLRCLVFDVGEAEGRGRWGRIRRGCAARKRWVSSGSAGDYIKGNGRRVLCRRRAGRLPGRRGMQNGENVWGRAVLPRWRELLRSVSSGQASSWCNELLSPCCSPAHSCPQATAWRRRPMVAQDGSKLQGWLQWRASKRRRVLPDCC